MNSTEENTLTIPQALDLAVEHHNGGRLPEAEALYRQILQHVPQHPVALHLLGVIAFQVGNHEVAVDLIGQAISVDPNNADFHSNLGNVQRSLGQLEEALVSYERALSLNPNFIAAYGNLANTLGELGRPEEAVTTYNKALQLSPDDANTLFNLGNSLKELGRVSEAITSFQKAVTVAPTHAKALNNLCNALKAEKRYEEALGIAQRALELSPGDAETLNSLGFILQKLKRPDEAIETYKKALEIKPGLAEAYSNLGSAYQELGQWDAAFECSQKAGALTSLSAQDTASPSVSFGSAGPATPVTPPPDTTAEDYSKAVAHHKNGRLKEAAQLYQSILERNGRHVASLHNLGVIKLDEGNPNRAVDLLQRALTIQPDYARAYNSLGVALQELALWDEAISAYRQSVDINPADPLSHHNLGTTLFKNGQLDEALASFQEVLRRCPEDVDSRVKIGGIYLNQLKLDEAAACFKNILALNPNSAEAHLNLGITMERTEQPEQATAYFEKAVALKPDYSEAQFGLGKSYMASGKILDAFDHCAKAVALKPDYDDAWSYLSNAAKVLLFQQTLNLDEILSKIDPSLRSCIHYDIFAHSLNAKRPHTADASFETIINNLLPSSRASRSAYEASSLPGKPVALFHFGRSGTGLIHSLIDNHPEISTLPSIYFGGYFNAGLWQEFNAKGRQQLPELFADKFAVLFDATSPKPVPSAKSEGLEMIGFKEGMANVGDNRDEVLTVDKEAFLAETHRLMEGVENLGPGLFLKIAHAAYEKAIGTTTDKHTLFYHIHNPKVFTKYHFLSEMPDARLMTMIRNPVQSLESWVKESARDNNYTQYSRRIRTMLFDIDRVMYRKYDSIGVKLEDVKGQPEATLRALCKWIGIEDHPNLYEMTAQGKKWWGDPSSPDYSDKKEMSPFDDSCFKRPKSTVFGDRDRFMLETLFHPFSVHFGYCEEDPTTFRNNLKEVRPLLDDLFEFERDLIDKTQADVDLFRRREDYLLLRAALSDRLDVLEELGTYPNMLTPLTPEKDG